MRIVVYNVYTYKIYAYNFFLKRVINYGALGNLVWEILVISDVLVVYIISYDDI